MTINIKASAARRSHNRAPNCAKLALQKTYMATIYRKTVKGQTEIETRLYRLVPRLRTALILVDGHRSDTELAKLIAGDAVATLQALLTDGFVEVASIVEQRAAPRPPARHEPHATPIHAQAFEQRQRDAVHTLTDLVGPMAEALAIRMEKCKDWEQLLPILQIAQQVVRNTRGAAAAADFASRFIDTPPS